MSTSENSTPLKAPAETAPPKNEAVKSAPTFDVWEHKLIGLVGLTKDELRSIRKAKLTEGEHWIIDKKRVVYGAAGVQELERILKVTRTSITAKAPQGSNADVPWPLKAEQTITLKVFRAGLANHHIIEAYFPGKNPAKNPGDRLRVEVRDDKHFVPGMEIPVTEIGKDLYRLARACPRSRGRW